MSLMRDCSAQFAHQEVLMALIRSGYETRGLGWNSVALTKFGDLAGGEWTRERLEVIRSKGLLQN